MFSHYEELLSLAKEQSFSSFTPLQENTFRSEDTYDNDKDLFIIGETSSGKTLIPLLLYLFALKQQTEYPKMLFVVPYRALAAQKKKEMESFFHQWNLTIVQSTGEFRQADELIQQANIHIAVVISEKVYKYAARDTSFLSKYDFLVLDEIGLINNSERGVRLDFIFAWANYQRVLKHKPRIIALGTPFFDWDAYIESYQFTSFKTTERPVTLKETQIIYSNGGIISVDGDQSFLYPVRRLTRKNYNSMKEKYEEVGSPCTYNHDDFCPYLNPCRMDRTLVCPNANIPCPYQFEFAEEEQRNSFQYILLKICRESLLKGYQTLIFLNDRERVMRLCGFLYHNLKQYLREAPPSDECRAKLLQDCGLETDDLFGIMEYESTQSVKEDYYRAFYSGIGFHSAALPNELRTYVENKLLESREMKIVCSTETLAFGVNSTVDVVIIADLYKHDRADVRSLTLNEYNNYVGRAGRLRSDMDVSKIHGYVYTLMNKKQAVGWKKLKEKEAHPEKLYSLFHTDNGQYMPFFLINILPENSAGSLSVSEIADSLYRIPQNSSVTNGDLSEKIQKSIRFLTEHGLVTEALNRPLPRKQMLQKQGEKKYCLTEFGMQMRGYIIDCDDFIDLLKAIEEYVSGIFLTPNKAHFLYRLLCTNHAESGLNSVYYDSETRVSAKTAFESIKQYSDCETDSFDWLNDNIKPSLLSILGALLAWSEGESPKYLYRRYGIHYALLHKLAEQIAYLIEIGCEILPMQMTRVYLRNREIYNKMNIDLEKLEKAVEEKRNQMHKLFISIYYGINTKVTDIILEELKKMPQTQKSEELITEMSLTQINPILARKFRSLIIRYRFFDNPPEIDMTNIELRNNFWDQRKQYYKDVVSCGEEITTIFRNKFGEKFTDEKAV